MELTAIALQSVDIVLITCVGIILTLICKILPNDLSNAFQIFLTLQKIVALH